jgi:POT family proton-dependent oligopeptide transporter
MIRLGPTAASSRLEGIWMVPDGPLNSSLHDCSASGAAPGFAGHPAGLARLFLTEMWERFSYYGMRALLVLYMTAPATAGGLGFGNAEAARTYGTYTMAVYLLAIPGGFLADSLLGARRAVLVGGVMITCGHFSLAVPSLATFFLGLVLIALGTGLFKPSISALVGALYASGDDRRDAGFSIFYMGINLGAFFSPLVTGFLAQSQAFKAALASAGVDPAMSWHWGFAAAGVGMMLALASFMVRPGSLKDIGGRPDRVLGAARHAALVAAGTAVLFLVVVLSDVPGFTWLRALFVLAPAAAIAWFARRPEVDARRVAAIFVFFLASMVFWAIFEQAGLSIALFADRLTHNEVAGFAIPSAWYQSLNPLFVILFAPVLAALWIRLGARQPSAPIKFVLGLALLSASLLLMVPAAAAAVAGKVSPWWLVGLFLLQTLGELCLSPVGLSTMTKLAPERQAGLVMGIWFLAGAWGSKLAGVLGEGFTPEEPAALVRFFAEQAVMVAVATVVLWALVPWVRRLMGGLR